MGLDSSAIINYSYYVTHMGLNESDAELTEERFDQFANAASDFVLNYTGMKYITATAYEIFDGDGTKDYFTKYVPINSSPTIEYWDGTTWQTESNSDWTYDSARGRVWYTDGNVFTKGRDNWRLTYNYGYSIANVPDSVKYATAILVQRMLSKANGKEGVANETFSDIQVAYNFSQLPQDVKMLLESNRRKARIG